MFLNPVVLQFAFVVYQSAAEIALPFDAKGSSNSFFRQNPSVLCVVLFSN
jgi:hypothetical protein